MVRQPPPARPSGDEADEHRPQQVGDQSEQGELPPEGQQAEPVAAYGPQGAAHPHGQKAGCGHRGTPSF